MASIAKRLSAWALAVVMAAGMSATAFAAESYTAPDNTGGGTPTLVQQSGDGYSSITIYDGKQAVMAPQYTGEMQGDFSQVGEVNPTRYYPFEITNIDERGTWLVVKSFEVPEGVDPQTQLVETNMVRDGKVYEARDILLKKTPGNTDSREASKKVTVTSESKDKAKVMALLDETTFYSEGGYEGYLTLDPDSITTKVKSTSNYSYPMTEKKEYTGLARNDPSLIEKTITKNGVTLTLGDVNWMSMGSTVSGDNIVSSYKAVATYTGTAYGSKADAYVVTANYTGIATKEVAGDYIYSIIYAPAAPKSAAPAVDGTASPFGDNGEPAGRTSFLASLSAGFNNFGFGPVKGWGVIGALGLLSLLIAGVYFLIQYLKTRPRDDARSERKTTRKPEKKPRKSWKSPFHRDDSYDDEGDGEEDDDDFGEDEKDAEADENLKVGDDPSIYLPPKAGVMNLAVDDDPELAALFGNVDDDGAEDEDESESDAADEDPEPKADAEAEDGTSLEFTKDAE